MIGGQLRFGWISSYHLTLDTWSLFTWPNAEHW